MTTSLGASSPTRPWSRPAAAEPIYFGAADRRCFGWYHAASPVASDTPALVICPSLGYEELCSHRTLRHFALAAAAAGIPCLRIDYHGTGNSAGNDLDAERLAAWEGSISDAIDELRARSGHRRIALLGVRIGATLAARVAARRGDVDDLALWATAVNGRSYLRELRAFARLHAGAILDEAASELPDGAFEAGGYVITAAVQQDVGAIDLLSIDRAPARRVLLVPRGGIDVESGLSARLRALGSDVETRKLQGYSQAMLEPHNAVVPQDVLQGVIGWLRGDDAVSVFASHTPLAAGGQVLELPAEPLESQGVARTGPSPAGRIIERPLVFGDGAGIFGILTEPSTGAAAPGARRTGIVLVNGGAVHQVGPNRLHVTLARTWATLGYRVLRIDLTGLGDTPPRPDAEENRTYSTFSVPDIRAAMAELRAHGAERCLVAGLCSGAHAAFHTALNAPELEGAIMINPIVFYWNPTMALDISAWRTSRDTHQYKKSVRSWRSWGRLFRGKVRLRYVAGVVAARTAQQLRAKLAAAERALRPARADGNNEARDLSRIHAQGTDALLVFSEGEPGLDHLMMHHRRAVRRLARNRGFRLYVLERADHIFSTLEARRRLITVLTEHLERRHP